MTRAMILCAGLGTRLGPLGDELPKPLAPMVDLPLCRYGIALLVGHGIRDIVINLHYRGDLFEQELGDGRALGARIQYSREPVLLGTGGGLKHALGLLDPEGLDEPFISMNGKLVFDLDLGALLAAHRQHPDALATMVVREDPDAVEWGAVDLDGELRVRNILGGGRHMFCGVHVTRPSVVRRLPDGEACMIRQGYLPWLGAGAEVRAFVAGGYFAEHSTPARYLAGNLALLGGAPLRHPPGPLAGIDPAAEVDPGARIEPPVRIGPRARVAAGAVVGPGAVIGRDAEIGPHARVERAVVWSGARVDGEAVDAVVTRRGLVSAR
jgi:NDP-sugar pyrophosphorylase family protein